MGVECRFGGLFGCGATAEVFESLRLRSLFFSSLFLSLAAYIIASSKLDWLILKLVLTGRRAERSSGTGGDNDDS
jgi:hypothetical protein